MPSLVSSIKRRKTNHIYIQVTLFCLEKLTKSFAEEHLLQSPRYQILLTAHTQYCKLLRKLWTWGFYRSQKLKWKTANRGSYLVDFWQVLL